MSSRSTHKMQREVGWLGLLGFPAGGVGAAQWTASTQCKVPAVVASDIAAAVALLLQVRLMRMLRSQEGVATILGDFQDEVGGGFASVCPGIDTCHSPIRQVSVSLARPGPDRPTAHVSCTLLPPRQAFYYIIMEHCAGGDLYHRMILNGEFDEHWACKKVRCALCML